MKLTRASIRGLSSAELQQRIDKKVEQLETAKRRADDSDLYGGSDWTAKRQSALRNNQSQRERELRLLKQAHEQSLQREAQQAATVVHPTSLAPVTPKPGPLAVRDNPYRAYLKGSKYVPRADEISHKAEMLSRPDIRPPRDPEAVPGIIHTLSGQKPIGESKRMIVQAAEDGLQLPFRYEARIRKLSDHLGDLKQRLEGQVEGARDVLRTTRGTPDGAAASKQIRNARAALKWVEKAHNRVVGNGPLND